MRRKYKSKWWSVELPDDWEAKPDQDCVAFTSALGVGTLQISAYRCDAENVTDEDLLEFAEDEFSKGETPHSASFGEFAGLETSYFSDENFWRKLWLRNGSLLLFITYNCAKDENSIEIKVVNTILGSLCLK